MKNLQGRSVVLDVHAVDTPEKNEPIYAVERYITIRKRKVLFGDGSHILYVNGKYRGNDEVGKLMHGFSCTNPDDMNYKVLAPKARYFKRDEKGVTKKIDFMQFWVAQTP